MFSLCREITQERVCMTAHDDSQQPGASVWDDERDEVDIDSQIDDALEEGQYERLPGLLADLIGLLSFQGREQEAREFRSFMPAFEAWAAGAPRRALFVLIEEVSFVSIQPALLHDKLLMVLGTHLEERGDGLAALAAWTECEDEDSNEYEQAQREALGLDEFGFEQAWNQEILAHYEGRVEEASESVQDWCILAQQHQVLNQPEQALQAARRAVSLDVTRVLAQQIIVEVLEEQGEHERWRAHIEEVCERWPRGLWPWLAKAEYMVRVGQDLALAREACAKALTKTPCASQEGQSAFDDANELMCQILRELENWEALAKQLEAMVARAEDRLVLYDLYDDLAEVYEEHLHNETKARAARSKADIFADAWGAVSFAYRVFMEEPTSRRYWRVLLHLVNEVGDWEKMTEASFVRLEHTDDHGEIHDIYEGLFRVFHLRMEFPPWRRLKHHLKERLEETQTPALRLLLEHHLGWVSGQIDDDVPSHRMMEEEEPPTYSRGTPEHARELAFAYASPWYAYKGMLSLGGLLVLFPLAFVVYELFPSYSPMRWIAALGVLLAGGWALVAWLRWSPFAYTCLLCGSTEARFVKLRKNAREMKWARPGNTSHATYTSVCRACGFDSITAFQPGASSWVGLFEHLKEATGIYHKLMTQGKETQDSLPYPSPQDKQDAAPERSFLLYLTVQVWNHLFQMRQLQPKLLERYREMLLQGAPSFAQLEALAPELWACWSEQEELFREEEGWFDECALSWELSPEEWVTSMEVLGGMAALLEEARERTREKIFEA